MKYIVPSSRIIFTDMFVLLVSVLMALNSVMSFSREGKEGKLPPVNLPGTAEIQNTGITTLNEVFITIQQSEKEKVYFYNDREVSLCQLINLIQKAKAASVTIRADCQAIGSIKACVDDLRQKVLELKGQIQKDPPDVTTHSPNSTQSLDIISSSQVTQADKVLEQEDIHPAPQQSEQELEQGKYDLNKLNKVAIFENEASRKRLFDDEVKPIKEKTKEKIYKKPAENILRGSKAKEIRDKSGNLTTQDISSILSILDSAQSYLRGASFNHLDDQPKKSEDTYTDNSNTDNNTGNNYSDSTNSEVDSIKKKSCIGLVELGE